jgi:hypothetical protein
MQPKVTPVDNRSSTVIPTSRYDEFLFASVCEEANGMPLSVLSALARMNVDPWEEAARLAAMPKEVAEKTLVSTFDVASASIGKPSEAETIAARLVRLLPHRTEGATAAATEIAGARSQRTLFSLIWLCFAIALSLLSARHHATTVDAGVSTSSPASQSESPTADGTLSGEGDKSH